MQSLSALIILTQEDPCLEDGPGHSQSLLGLKRSSSNGGKPGHRSWGHRPTKDSLCSSASNHMRTKTLASLEKLKLIQQ